MSFLWPEFLWLLALIPVLIGLYALALRRKKKLAVRYASLAMIRDAQGVGQRIRRHIPPFMFLIGLSLMLVAIARPTAIVTLPTQHEIVILTMDVSGSMRAVDVKPTRLAAAQEAARAFIRDQPSNVKIGIVSFAGTAAVVQAPTDNRDDLLAAIDRFELQRATAIGSGLLVSLKAIFPDVEFDLRSSNPRLHDTSHGVPIDKAGTDQAKEPPKPVPPGSYKSAIIILLTDGQTTTGPDPIESAKMAAERGVRVYTVGIGTVEGEVIGWEGWSMRVRLDEDSLKQIANVTRGEYFHAGNAVDLKNVYKSMSSKMELTKQQTEITALFVAAAAFFVVVGAGLSLAWFNRLL
ncbi:MAG TPA: VWA domain-containing protein [Casimicrobiaceae bacterium]|nr:VWA domain-containing protein [Casimicrobiaceae bacterium]